MTLEDQDKDQGKEALPFPLVSPTVPFGYFCAITVICPLKKGMEIKHYTTPFTNI